MKTIPVTDKFLVDGAEIDTVNVHPITFVELVQCLDKAHTKLTKDGNIQTLLRRERIIKQAHFMAGDARKIPDAAAISLMPIPVARQVIGALEEGQGAQGEVIGDGDGIEKPILYKLGTPIAIGGKDKKPITELEFIAKKYGDIEDVLAADGDPLGQAELLIRKVATPPEIESLSVLPDWAVQRITSADGLLIARDVLPRFLG